MSALPLRPFGVPDMVWPQGMCEVCYEPQWSDALHDWEFVEDATEPCRTCQLSQVVLTDLAPRADAREGSR